MSRQTQRRRILIAGLAATGALVGQHLFRRNRHPLVTAQLPVGKMPEQELGQTGVKVPILGLGGAGQTPLSQPFAEEDSIALLENAYAMGIRYFDTAASYGPSEDYLGKILPAYRSQIFLASKTAARDRDGAWRELERSLSRLKTDHLDLWQLHHVADREDLDQIFAKNGAIKAIEEAQAQGLVRFVGITGHHEPDIIAEGLRRYPFHTTLIPVNAADPHHPRPFIPGVLPVAQERQVGVIAMKVPAYGRLLKPGLLAGMQEAMGYALSQSGVHCCIIAAESVQQLAANVRTAQAFQPLEARELRAIEQKTAAAWQDNTFFRNWA